MNEHMLSLRLSRVGSFVPKAARLADIGSDHAYLPVALLLQKKISFAVAGEVVQGPYDSAKKQVEKNGLEKKIAVRLANGLEAIKKEDLIDTITIAGMGGALITDILENGKNKGLLTGEERLILQPNVGEKGLREWLVENHYQIVEEAILEEKQKIYEIIVAQKGESNYTPQELLFGPKLLLGPNTAFKKKWQLELELRQRVLQQLSEGKSVAEKKAALKKESEWIQEVLA